MVRPRSRLAAPLGSAPSGGTGQPPREQAMTTGADRFAVEVADGRSVEVLVAGPRDGLPLVFHTGTPGGLVGFAPLTEAASARHLRTVCYARPGYGSSDPQPGRRVADAASDV